MDVSGEYQIIVFYVSFILFHSDYSPIEKYSTSHNFFLIILEF